MAAFLFRKYLCALMKAIYLRGNAFSYVLLLTVLNVRINYFECFPFGSSIAFFVFFTLRKIYCVHWMKSFPPNFIDFLIMQFPLLYTKKRKYINLKTK